MEPQNRRLSLAEMLNPGLKLANAGEEPAAPPPRRRQSMAEMLRESSLLGNTVSLVDAVESAQAAAARKAEGQEAAVTAAPAAAPLPPATEPIRVPEPTPQAERENPF